MILTEKKSIVIDLLEPTSQALQLIFKLQLSTRVKNCPKKDFFLFQGILGCFF